MVEGKIIAVARNLKGIKLDDGNWYNYSSMFRDDAKVKLDDKGKYVYLRLGSHNQIVQLIIKKPSINIRKSDLLIKTFLNDDVTDFEKKINEFGKINKISRTQTQAIFDPNLNKLLFFGVVYYE